jgi:hypothetical protein
LNEQVLVLQDPVARQVKAVGIEVRHNEVHQTDANRTARAAHHNALREGHIVVSSLIVFVQQIYCRIMPHSFC